MKTKRSVSRLRSFFTVPVIITGLILATVLFASIFANFIVPFDPEEANLADSLCKPLQNGHLLGTDKLGRDLFSRLIAGARSSIFNAVLIVAFEMAVGIPIGLICGYYGGSVDKVIMRFWDIVCSLPSLLLAFVLVTAFGNGTYIGVIAMGIV